MQEKCLNLDLIRFDASVISFFQNNQEKIIEAWVMYPTLFDILNKFQISHNYYKENVAIPVYNYFITIITGENKPGDCPVMRKVIELFYGKGFKVEDVFLSCTAFKNTLNTHLYQNKIDQTMIINLMMILDANLSSILAIYSQKMEDREKLIKKHNEIIQNHVLLTITDEDGLITHVTDAFAELSGYDKDELIGRTHKVIGDPNESLSFFDNLWQTISSGNKWHGKIKNIKKTGEPFILDTSIIPVKDNHDEIVEYMAIRENITDREIFQYDELTKVYTRRIFDEKFNLLLRESKNNNQHFTVILGDIDHFKKVNDTYGHQKGDEILKEFTAKIEKNIRNNDMCFRWGGEEFIILLPFATIDVATNVANRIRKDFNREVAIEGNFLSASFGLTELQERDTKESIFKRADEALYKAKQNGRNQVQIVT